MLVYSWELASRGRAGGSPAPLTGLDWNGNPAGQRAVIYANPHSNGLPAYPATYIWKVYQRNQVTGIGDGTRYYTNFFHGNDGAFVWGGGYTDSYYGAHPYPEGVGNPGKRDGTDDGKWEISAHANDNTELDNNTAPYPTYNQWYSQALVVSSSGGNLNHKYYVNLPSTTTANTITWNFAATYTQPPSPILIWGQAPDNGSGLSWGDYSRWEEQNAIIRGVQVYNDALIAAQVVALSAFDYDSQVTSYCTSNSITSLWYLNMNWTTSDVTDKSGNGHHMSIRSTNSAQPANWSS